MPHPNEQSDAGRLVELFARARPVYARSDVLRLLGISDAQLTAAIRSGAVTEEHTDTGAVAIPWEDVAMFALEEWTPRMIEAALRTEASDVIPHLNQHRLIRVSLPIYLIRLLDHLARDESAVRHVARNASDILERVLHDFANTVDSAVIAAECRVLGLQLLHALFQRLDPLPHRRHLGEQRFHSLHLSSVLRTHPAFKTVNRYVRCSNWVAHHFRITSRYSRTEYSRPDS